MLSFPNCKINLGLHVVRRRDDGYHDLETLFLPVALRDRLEIEPAQQFSFAQEGIAIGGGAEQNIVVRAYRLMQNEFSDAIGPVAIRLTKNIPFGAGLGGGSSDAAFALTMLNELFAIGLDGPQLRHLAARLGADCAFFVDNVPAYATGIGDQLTPLGLNPIEGYALLLVKPDEAVSTAEAYRGITPRNKRATPPPTDLRQAVGRPIAEWRELIVNDFEESVFPQHPLLAEIKRQLYAAGALYAAMSGSGSTVYGILNAEADRQTIEAQMARYGQLFFLK